MTENNIKRKVKFTMKSKEDEERQKRKHKSNNKDRRLKYKEETNEKKEYYYQEKEERIPRNTMEYKGKPNSNRPSALFKAAW